MAPYIIIFIAALIGGYLNGFVGFFLWGAIAFGGTLIVGLALQTASGGLISKKVRVQTALDFLAANPELVSLAWPNYSASEQRKQIENLLEAIYLRAITESKSFHLDAAVDLEHLVSSARQVVMEQDSEGTRAVAAQLIDFLLTHSLWYGRAGNT